MVLFERVRRFAAGEKGVDDQATTSGSDAQHNFIADGDLKYAIEQSGNGSGPTYQEASGAPVETHSPLGYAVGPITIMFLNISKMIGTGVYSTPAAVLTGVGSVGLAMFYWTLGSVIAISSLAVYLEYAAYFSNRSGSEVVYLEQAYPRPRYLFPTAFAVQSVILSFSSGNSIVLSRYLFRVNGHVPTDWELKGVAVAGYTVAVLLLVFSTKFGYYLSNGIGIIKLLTLIFISITGLVVLGGHTRVQNPTVNFHDAFEGTSNAPYGLTNALVKIIFSYAGYENAFNVVNEVKNPVRTIRNNATISLLIVTVLYILANIAYFAAVPKDQLKASKQIAASLFFEKVFGSSSAVKGLNILIALSSFGNLITVLIGQSRLIRECGRQGVLPWPRFWASTKPFDTPLGPYLVKWTVTIIMILAPPAGDAFNFIVNLQSYPSAAFNVAMAAGLYLVRYRRHKVNLPRGEFKAWDVAVVFNILANLYILIMPWYPPPGGRNGGDVSFWYGTYIVVGIAILVVCGIYYWLWIFVIPQWRGYRIRQETLVLDGGANTHKLVKVPVAKLEEWDASHDPLGRRITDASSLQDGASGSDEDHGKTIYNEPKV